MKRSQCIDIVETLTKFTEQKLPVKLAYRVSRILEKCQKEKDFFENERIKLIRGLGQETEAGQIEVKEENREFFFTEINNVLNEEVEIKVPMIPLEMFPDSVVLSTQDMVKLACIIEEPM